MRAVIFLAMMVCAAWCPTSRATVAGVHAVSEANPVRRVVKMLQDMKKKVIAEGEKEKEMYNKYKCYCKNSGGELSGSIAAAEAKGPAVTADIAEAEGQKEQMQNDLKAHKANREAAKASVTSATELRETEAAKFAALKAEQGSNIVAIDKAVTALEKGAGAGFLQTGTAQLLRRLAESRDMLDVDRQAMVSFLSGEDTSKYAPQSGQITGILKQLGGEMRKDLAEATDAEKASVKNHEELMEAKSEEISANTNAIEEKTVRVGELGVSIVDMKNDLTNTQASLADDQAFLAELEEGCSTQDAQWEAIQKTRSEELVALAETITMLNNDDALELFKKAVPVKGASFLQAKSTSSVLKSRALALVRSAQRVPGRTHSVDLNFIALALQGKTAGFEKVTAMIDEMVGVLKGEQKDDDTKKEYCATEFDLADDKKKGLETTISNEENAIASAEEGIAKLTDELKALATGIAELDKSVAEATEQRKDEHAEYSELTTLNAQAKELLGFAKNRLNKFYNPKLYVPPPEKELTAEDRAYGSVVGLVQRHGAAPAPPPDALGAYEKKSQESNGVIAMIDLLVKDLDKETTEAETDEKNAQEDYEKLMADAKAKRAADAKAVTDKEGVKANLQAETESRGESKAAATKELIATAEYIAGLHSECDWLVQYYDARKEARAGEVESLARAKAVLAGADFSLVQLHDRRLRGTRK